MSYLTTDELSSHLYTNISAAISRGDTTLLQTAINAAIDEAKGYLTAYDTDAIFNAVGDDRLAILLFYVKDIAVWHLVALNNAGTDLSLREDRYTKAIAWLTGVQAGKINPPLPLPAPPDCGEQNNFIKWGSANPSRKTYF